MEYISNEVRGKLLKLKGLGMAIGMWGTGQSSDYIIQIKYEFKSLKGH